ncbi:hypothetical protein [Maribacter litoralis]|uniref:hypothetical protein n=1 Tax=Maribacter litoralis TaxID=2059726 RepID=UPI003D271291
MSKVVFRNYDLKAIKNLLKEIGQERYEGALKDADIIQKPLSMKGFYIEYECKTGNISLYHRYPSGISLFIIDALGYWAIPHHGWEMLRVK